MVSFLETGFIHVDQYCTDGNRLYRIVEINNDETVQVENCETLFTNTIALETVLYWKEVDLNAIP